MSKKALLILFSGLLYCCSVKAQGNDTLLYKMHILNISETVKYDALTDNKDSVDFIKFVLPPDSSTDNELFIVNEYYKNGKKKLIGKSVGKKAFSNLQGACIEFFPNGRRKSIKNFENGVLVGDMTEYFPNGKVYLISNNDTVGKKVIINECRDSMGKVLVENGNGHCIKYNNDFKYVIAEGNVINGLEEGEWHGVVGDSSHYVCAYQEGVVKNGIGYDKGKEHPFINASTAPTFKGGMNKFYNYLKRNINFPTDIKGNVFDLKVYLSFIVNKDGHLSDFKILKAYNPSTAAEALRVLKLTPKWIPGYYFGIPIRQLYNIPITFSSN
jgi:hypothetical protein